jgi:hypothetical protein
MGVRNKMTIAGVKRLERAISAPETVSTGRALSNADNGKVLDVTAALTLTIPEGELSPGFRCWFVAPSGVNLSIDPLGAVTLNGAGTTLTRARAGNACTVELFMRAANTALLSGA